MIQKLWKRNNSLKNRLFQLIMLGTIVSILVSFILARMTISSVEKEQIHSAMQFSLDQICSCFDQGYLNLVNIMQNLEAKVRLLSLIWSSRKPTISAYKSSTLKNRLQILYLPI